MHGRGKGGPIILHMLALSAKPEVTDNKTEHKNIFNLLFFIRKLKV